MPNRRKETNIYAGNKKIKLQEWHSYNPERQKERAKRVDIVREKERKKERERDRERKREREKERKRWTERYTTTWRLREINRVIECGIN